jgi:hypothetical protein
MSAAQHSAKQMPRKAIEARSIQEQPTEETERERGSEGPDGNTFMK